MVVPNPYSPYGVSATGDGTAGAPNVRRPATQTMGQAVRGSTRANIGPAASSPKPGYTVLSDSLRRAIDSLGAGGGASAGSVLGGGGQAVSAASPQGQGLAALQSAIGTPQASATGDYTVGDVSSAIDNVLAGGNATGGSGQAKTAFGKSFQPGAFEQLWDNPEALIQQYMNFRGITHDTGTLATLMDQADNLGMLWMMDQHAGKPGAGDDYGTSAAGFADWSGTYLGEQMKPGGQYLSPQQVMSAILDPNPDSWIHQQFNSSMLTPANQVDNVLQAVRAGLEGSVPAPMLNAMLAKINFHGTSFIAWRMTEKDGGSSFTDYLDQQKLKAGNFGY